MHEIILPAHRKKNITSLLALLKEVGFGRVAYTGGTLTLEAFHEKNELDYQIKLTPKTIQLKYDSTPSTLRTQFLEVMPVFLNVLVLAQPFYDVQPAPLFQDFQRFISELRPHLGKDMLDLTSEMDELRTKHSDLTKKYDALVRSSEENARILLECERRRDELHKRSEQLEGLSDEALKQALFDWIKVHGGAIEITEFARSHALSTRRVEEGLQLLTNEGYIKRRSHG